MSSLTSDVRIVYMPVLYDIDDKLIREGRDCYDEEEAIEVGELMVQEYVKLNQLWCYVRIELRIMPIYE